MSPHSLIFPLLEDDRPIRSAVGTGLGHSGRVIRRVRTSRSDDTCLALGRFAIVVSGDERRECRSGSQQRKERREGFKLHLWRKVC